MKFLQTILVVSAFQVFALVESQNISDFEQFLTKEEVVDPGKSVLEVIRSAGFEYETYSTTTLDGYILQLHRIPHSPLNKKCKRNRPPVLLHHGITSSSADFLVNGRNNSLGYLLADAGYDVWMANARGNQYSRRHKMYDPDSRRFWDFSWDSIALFDLPAAIDGILKHTGQSQLNYVGFSMGTTLIMALLSERPEYNNKVKVAALMAPVAYVGNVQGMAKELAPMANVVDSTLHLLSIWELLRGDAEFDKLVQRTCGQPHSPKMLMCISLMDALVGPNKGEYNQDILPRALSVIPAGVSVHSLLHYVQMVLSGKFQKFDYGSERKNRQRYGQDTPPNYYLKRVKIPVGLISGVNDFLSNPKDVSILRKTLPNVVHDKIVKSPPYNHLDFLWGKHLYEAVLKDILVLFDKYNKNDLSCNSHFGIF